MIAGLSKYEMCFSYYYNTQFCFVRQNKINISFDRSKRPFLSDKYTKKPLKPKIFRFSNFIDFHTYIVKQPDFSLISSSCTPCFRHFSSALKAFLRAFSFRHFFFLEVIYIRWMAPECFPTFCRTRRFVSWKSMSRSFIWYSWQLSCLPMCSTSLCPF